MPLPEIQALPLELVYRFSRKRFAVPIILAATALALVFNELSYHNTAAALKIGDALAEARIAAAGVLQLVTDAETGQRGYLLTGRSEYLEPLTAAKVEVPRMHATVSAFLDASGADGHAAALRMAKALDATLAETEETLRLARAGEREAALRMVDAGQGRRRMDDMRSIFTLSLSAAATQQHEARESIARSLRATRIAVTVLMLLCALGLCFYVRHLRRDDRQYATRHQGMEAQASARADELRELAGYLLTAREDEKAHLARELHDELGAVLTAAKFDLVRMRKLVNDPVLAERLLSLDLRLNEGIALKRRIVEDLRPSSLATLGLTVSLENLCNDVSGRLAIPVLTKLQDVQLTADGELAVYRLVQEALTNVAKYARATQVSVSVSSEAGLVHVRIEDDGIGFDTSLSRSATHGIAGMRFRIERLSGSLSLASQPGAGTQLHGCLPVVPKLAKTPLVSA